MTQPFIPHHNASGSEACKTMAVRREHWKQGFGRPKPRLRSHVLLSIAVAVSLLLHPTAAFAAAPTVTGVEPASVSNVSGTNLVVKGTEFITGAMVVLDGYGALTTTFVSSTVLTAALPAGVPTGSYTVKVVNPDSTSGSLASALTITGPTATPAPTAFVRPVVVVQSYGASSTAIVPGTDIDFEITLVNSGQGTATNVVATFTAGDFIPRSTGGVRSVGSLGPGQSARFFQPLSATSGLSGKTIGTLEVKVSYTDSAGTAYGETFALTFPVARPQGPSRTATPTPRPNQRPQLLITGYRTDVDSLEPGSRFNLALDVRNAGSQDAKRVTLILGGGSSSGGSPGGTPGAGSGGVSGASGEFTNFAPLGSSNVQYLGDIAAGGELKAAQALIVNSSTKAGAYPVKVSLVYTDEKGTSFTDDQVITLLVYQSPSVEISFYRETGPLFAGQPSLLPLQVVNLGRNSAVLGNMKVSADGAQLSNNVTLVGALDTGGYFTLDATIIPERAGPFQVTVTVEYTDDFNQPQIITKILDLDVMEAPVMDPGIDGEFEPPLAPETFLQKVWRFIRGLFGLDSAVPSPAPVGPGDVPIEGIPPDSLRPIEPPVIAPKG